MPRKEATSKPRMPREETITFTLEDWNRYKIAGTNTGIVKDFPDWLEENK